MQSKTGEFVTELESYDIEESHLKSFELYEEYSQRIIADTIRIRRENFAKTDLKAKRELQIKVEREVKNFRTWLEETKNLEPNTAYYYSVSLKSLLLGLPVGVQVARFFGTIMDKLARK
ncbi:hypothetical protein IBX35_00140 [Candidatus Bathyarchaeota archaeon]|nr:hypothetical protein [Candidatus Bathyarchaeota archaeon]